MVIADIVCLVAIAAFLLLGVKNGGLYELVQLCLLAGAMVATALFHSVVSSFVFKFLKYSASMENLVYFGLLAVILFLVHTFLNRFIKTLVSFKEPSGVNRAAGGVFAAVKGFVYVGLVLIIIGLAIPDSKINFQIREGKVAGFIEDVVSKTTRTVDGKVKKSNVSFPDFD